MVCPICKEVKWNRKDWFNPQWQACSPIVDHCSGNYDRCKHCYYNTTSLVPTAANNGVDTKYDKYARWKPLEEFMLHWTSKNMHTSCFKDGVTPGSASASTDPTGSGHGERRTFDPQNVVYALAVQLVLHWMPKNIDRVTAGDPKQWLYVDWATAGKSYTSGSASASTGPTGSGHGERWTFDPQNVVYAKAVHLAWPALLGRFSNFETIGDIVESILGLRNYASNKGILMEQHQIIHSVCHHVSQYVNLVYQFTQYTETTYEDIELWKQYVSALNE